MSVLNQEAVLESLNNLSDVEKNIDIILEERSRLKQRLASIKKVNKIYPSDANFLLVNVDDADKTYNYLIDEKVIIRNRNKVINNCIRITVGTPEENEQLINALKAL